MYDKSKISEKVLKVEQSIEKEDKIKVLQSWYDNIKNYAGISDYEREYLIDAVEKKIRVKFPNKAKKILGGKSAKAQEMLDDHVKQSELLKFPFCFQLPAIIFFDVIVKF